MEKIWLIIQREYFTRVKKKSFILMTILGPLLFGGIIFGAAWLSTNDNEKQHLIVVDEIGAFQKLPETSNIKYSYTNQSLEEVKLSFHESEYTSILYIPKNIVSSNVVQVFFKSQPSFLSLNYIDSKITERIESMKIKSFEIDPDKYYSVKTDLALKTFKFSEPGKEEKSNQFKGYIGFIGAILNYIFIFMYGVQVMRGVMEEKTSRIVEVIISSVKPFELMMGKIIGIAMVGLTQFLLWVALTTGISAVSGVVMGDKYDTTKITSEMNVSENVKAELAKAEKVDVDPSELMEVLSTINIPVMLIMFIFFFIGGYLLYAALFAAVGAAVDNETDTQQFMMPITLPIIFGFVVSQMVIQNPESGIAFWFSMIPLTSPIVMMVRLPFGVDTWQILLSAALLIGGFVFTTWMAGKIYRTGILMYGKKVNYKELWKWLFYKS